MAVQQNGYLEFGRHRGAGIGITGAAALVLTACGGQSATPSALPAAAAPPPAAAEQVCQQLALTWFDRDTRTDASPAAAQQRAADRFGGARWLAEARASDTTGDPVQWLIWTRQHVQLLPQLIPDRPWHPAAEAPGTATTSATVALSATAPDGSRTPLPAMRAYCTEHAAGNHWQITAVDTGPARTTP